MQVGLLMFLFFFASFAGFKWPGADYGLAGCGCMCWELVWEGKVSDCYAPSCLLVSFSVDGAELCLPRHFPQTYKHLNRVKVLCLRKVCVLNCDMFLSETEYPRRDLISSL